MTRTAFDIDTPINEFVKEDMQRTALFEELGIDFCCGGQKTLAEACSEKGLDPVEILKRLTGSDTAAETSEERDWSEVPPGELVDHLESTHHAFTKQAMLRLSGLLEKVIAAHGKNHPYLLELGDAYNRLRADLEPHMMKEEQVLFPMVRRLADGKGTEGIPAGMFQGPVNVMRVEHDHAGEYLETIRSLTGNYAVPPDGCNTFHALMEGLKELEIDLHVHIHKENNILFPQILPDVG